MVGREDELTREGKIHTNSRLSGQPPPYIWRCKKPKTDPALIDSVKVNSGRTEPKCSKSHTYMYKSFELDSWKYTSTN